MADFVSTGVPRSIDAPLTGPSNPAVFELPQGVAFDLQSVFAEIDASGAGDTRATLTIADSSGAVIAKKRQGEPVTGGATGSATWALRLAGDGGAVSAVRAPSWIAALNLASGHADAMGAAVSVVDGNNPFTLGRGDTTLVATWHLLAGRKIEANVVNYDTVTHDFAMGPVYVQETATGAQEALRGNTITVASNNFGAFSFGPLTFGAPLLNLANPLAPTVVNTGTYAVTAIIQRAS